MATVTATLSWASSPGPGPGPPRPRRAQAPRTVWVGPRPLRQAARTAGAAGSDPTQVATGTEALPGGGCDPAGPPARRPARPPAPVPSRLNPSAAARAGSVPAGPRPGPVFALESGLTVGLVSVGLVSPLENGRDTFPAHLCRSCLLSLPKMGRLSVLSLRLRKPPASDRRAGPRDSLSPERGRRRRRRASPRPERPGTGTCLTRTADGLGGTAVSSVKNPARPQPPPPKKKSTQRRRRGAREARRSQGVARTGSRPDLPWPDSHVTRAKCHLQSGCSRASRAGSECQPRRIASVSPACSRAES